MKRLFFLILLIIPLSIQAQFIPDDQWPFGDEQEILQSENTLPITQKLTAYILQCYHTTDTVEVLVVELEDGTKRAFRYNEPKAQGLREMNIGVKQLVLLRKQPTFIDFIQFLKASE